MWLKRLNRDKLKPQEGRKNMFGSRAAEFITQHLITNQGKDGEAPFLWQLLPTAEPRWARGTGKKQLLTFLKQVSSNRSSTQSSGEFLEPEGYRTGKQKFPGDLEASCHNEGKFSWFHPENAALQFSNSTASWKLWNKGF